MPKIRPGIRYRLLSDRRGWDVYLGRSRYTATLAGTIRRTSVTPSGRWVIWHYRLVGQNTWHLVSPRPCTREIATTVLLTANKDTKT